MKQQFFMLFVAIQIAVAQSPLNRPGQKQITIGSEIARGASEIRVAATKSSEVSLILLEARMADVILQNRAARMDSEGFLLGARVEEILHLGILLNLDGVEQLNSRETMASSLKHAHQTALEIRRQQRQFGISDDALVDALEVKTTVGRELIKRVIAKYEGAGL